MRILVVPALLLASAATAEPGRAYVSELGHRVLRTTDQIVEASLRSVSPPFRGVVTARLRVRERLHGLDRNEEIVLLYVEDFLAPGAMGASLESYRARSSPQGLAAASGRAPRAAATPRQRETTGRTPYTEPQGVKLSEGDEGVFFLRRGGTTYSLVGFLPSVDPLAESKRRRLREVLDLEAEPRLDLRLDRLKRLCLDSLADADPWIRANSARELLALAQRYPGTLGPDDVRRMFDARTAAREPAVRASLERAILRADRRLGLELAADAEARESARFADALQREAKLLDAATDPLLRAAEMSRLARQYGLGATRLLAEALADPDADVRAEAARALGSTGGPSADLPLREALARERSTTAAAAMIEACGALGDEEAVPILARRLADRAVARDAVLALARIGGDAARRALVENRPADDAETARLVDALLDEEFPK